MSFEIMPVVLFGTIFPIVIGLFMRLPKLIIEIKQHKRWTFDWIKFIAIALPSFCVISIWFLPLLPFGEDFYRIPNIILVGSPMIQIIAGIVFGYILLDSLKK